MATLVEAPAATSVVTGSAKANPRRNIPQNNTDRKTPTAHVTPNTTQVSGGTSYTDLAW